MESVNSVNLTRWELWKGVKSVNLRSGGVLGN